MNPTALSALGTLLAAFGVGGVFVAIINTFLSPKARAEARQIARGTAREEIDMALATLRTDVNDARTRADAAETRADEADTKYDRLLRDHRILIEHMWRLQLWARRYYEGGHPPGMAPPPLLDLADVSTVPTAAEGGAGDAS